MKDSSVFDLIDLQITACNHQTPDRIFFCLQLIKYDLLIKIQHDFSKDIERHPTLASDLLEEWRAVIVDATVMSMIQGNEISINEFSKDEETGAVIISKKGVNLFIKKLEKKLQSNMNYLEYLEHPVSFRRAIWWQVSKIVKCIDNGNFDDYMPIRIR